MSQSVNHGGPIELIQLKEGRKEGNVLFNDALDTFYLRLYGIRHMVKDHSDSEGGTPLLPHRLLFPISSKGSFICTIPHMIAHTMAFVTPVMEHWLEQEIAQWVHPMKDRSDDPSHHERTLLPRSYISLLVVQRLCYLVCGLVYIKDPLLAIRKSGPCNDGSVYPLSLNEWSFTVCQMP